MSTRFNTSPSSWLSGQGLGHIDDDPPPNSLAFRQAAAELARILDRLKTLGEEVALLKEGIRDLTEAVRDLAAVYGLNLDSASATSLMIELASLDIISSGDVEA
jgi:hypothetical protein